MTVSAQEGSPSKLPLLAAPYFTTEPENYVGAEDETATFTCKAKGSPAPEIKWIYNGKPIEEMVFNPRSRILHNKIIIEGLSKKDTGNYGCNATNSIGYVYKDVILNVLALKPEIEDPPKDVATADGLDVELTCKVFGAPKPVVKWVRDGLELIGSRYRVLDSGNLLIRCFFFGSTPTVGTQIDPFRFCVFQGSYVHRRWCIFLLCL